MSSAVTAVTYNFNLTLTNTNDNTAESVYPLFTSAAGMTDELALAFANAWLGLSRPEGVTAQAWVTKHETDQIESEGDLTNGVFV